MMDGKQTNYKGGIMRLMKQYSLSFNTEKDADIITILDTRPWGQRADYIRDAIRLKARSDKRKVREKATAKLAEK